MYTDLKSTAVVVLAGLAASASAITGPGDFCYGNYFSMYNRGGASISYQRVDPAVNPGAEAAHLHSFDGGNNIKSTLTTKMLQDSTCTTNKFKQDKSLYWNPTLHVQNNGGFTRVPEMYKKIYYKFGEGSNNIKASGFPDDFMMVVGDSKARSADAVPSAAGISWACMWNDNGNHKRTDAPGFPALTKGQNGLCDDGFATQITFPSCWNGKAVDPAHPGAHMAYPTGGIGTDGCPSGFQVKRFPAIFIEFWWDITKLDISGDNPFVLSNGDPTGFGFHADFANGWDDGVLEKVISDDAGLKCGCGCGDDEFNAYFGADKVNSGDSWNECTATNEYPGEDLEFLPKLPGCNPLQYGPAAATAVSGEGCAAAPSSPASKTSIDSSTAVPVSTEAPVASSADSSSAITSLSASFTISLPGKGVESASETAAAAALSSSSVGFVVPIIAESSTKAPVATSLPSVIASDETPATAAASAYSSAEVPAPASTEAPVASSAVVSPLASSAVEAVPTGGCAAPIYITVTPTVYVTAGATAKACGQTIEVTVTETATATVTVQPSKGAGGYMHRRHMEAHLRHKH